MRTKEEFRELMRDHIRKRKWDELFTEGGCYFFALVLHEELHLPLFYYASLPDRNGFGHVFVMRGSECIDYCGKRPIEVVAKRYAWPDEQPLPSCPSEIKTKIREKGCGEELEEEIYQIAKEEFARRRQEFL